MINSDHMVGFAAGVGITALTIYWYNQNQERIDQFLRAQGLPPSGQPGGYGWPQAAQPHAQPVTTTGQGRQLSLEELVAQKEQLEDLIAEVQATQQQHQEGEAQKTPLA